MRNVYFFLIFFSFSMDGIYCGDDHMKNALSNHICSTKISEPTKKEAIEQIIDKKILNQCVELFHKTLDHFHHNNQVSFQTKKDGSLVSNLEFEIENVISGYLQQITPWAGFQGEEGINFDAQEGSNQYRWYLDPIDGTTSFHNGWDTFAFTLTLVKESEALATVIDFPRLSKTYIAYSGGGAFLNQTLISLHNALRSDKAILAVSDEYTFSLTHREAVLNKLRQLPYIPRTVTDIYGYCMVAEGKCIAKFDAAGALWDLWPGCLLIEEAGGKCLFFPSSTPTADLAGSMLVGNLEIIDMIHFYLKQTIDEKTLPYPSTKPHLR